MPRIVAAAFALGTFLLPGTAGATYSIIAVDPEAGVFGAAGASCVPYEVDRIYASVPGRGAFVAQANFDEPAFDAALSLLAGGASASEVLAQVSDEGSFPMAPKMQYGVVDASGELVTWTGREALPVAVDMSGEHLGASFGALGNVLTSSAVLDQAALGFRADACDLPERLLAALEAAGADGEGDSRCTPDGRPANSAFLDVTGSGAVILHISVPDVSPADPVAELRARFDAWRADHPCATPLPEQDEGGAGQGGNGTADDPEDAGGCSVQRTGKPAPWGVIALALIGLRRATRWLSSFPRPRPAQRRRRGGSRSGT